MSRKRLIWWLTVIVAMALPLAWSSTSLAESGCHRGGTGTGVATETGAPQ